jgi:RNA polymerase sigma factor (sigma-70 family)
MGEINQEVIIPLAGMVFAVISMLFPIAIVFIVRHFRHRRTQQVHDTVKHQADMGLPIPPELLDPPRAGGLSDSARFRAITLLGVGVGLVLMFYMLDAKDLVGIGVLLLSIGIAAGRAALREAGQRAALIKMGPGRDVDEALLVRRAQAGHLDAFESLVRRYQPRVRLLLRRLARGDVALADDLAQDAFVQAWRQLPQFRGDARLATWLHRIAVNAFLMDRRRRREEPLDPDAEWPDAASRDDVGLRLDVQRAIARLPEHVRLAIVHCFQLDLTHDEAAAALVRQRGCWRTSQPQRCQISFKSAGVFVHPQCPSCHLR